MRFSSSALKRLSGFLAALCLAEWSGAAVPCRAGGAEPVLLLKYASPSVPDGEARSRFSAIAEGIEKALDVRPSPASRPSGEPGPVLAEIDDATLKSIAGRASEAGRSMEALRNREAERQLDAIEKELRRYRLGDATRPILADVFRKRAGIALWDGNAGAATGYLRKARSLQPGFEPDPALYPPRFRELWAGLGPVAAEEAEVLVESVPPGARILVDGTDRGATPRRIAVPASRPVDLKLVHPGYQAATGSRQWLPGDSDRIEVLLDGDRETRLAAFLGKGASRIPEAGPIVSEMAAEAGTRRVAVLMLDRSAGREELRVLAATADSPVPRLLGTVRIEDGGLEAAVSRSAAFLASDGWPRRAAAPDPAPRPWYYKWWFLTGLCLLVAGTAVALSGGGGGGGSASTSAPSDVSF